MATIQDATVECLPRWCGNWNLPDRMVCVTVGDFYGCEPIGDRDPFEVAECVQRETLLVYNTQATND